MWLPCNFGESILIRQHSSSPLKQAELVGLSLEIQAFGGADYCFVFKVGKGLHHMQLNDTIAYWPHAFNNEDSYDINSLNPGEIDLKINIGSCISYNQYFFESKSRAEGKCISIHKHEDGWHYTFQGSNGLAKYFTVPKLFINKPFESYDDDILS